MINYPYYYVNWDTSEYVVIWINPKSKDPIEQSERATAVYIASNRLTSNNNDVLSYEEFLTYEDELREYGVLGDSSRYDTGIFCGECDETVKMHRVHSDEDYDNYEVLSPCHDCEVYSYREWDYENHRWIYSQDSVIQSDGI